MISIFSTLSIEQINEMNRRLRLEEEKPKLEPKRCLKCHRAGNPYQGRFIIEKYGVCSECKIGIEDDYEDQFFPIGKNNETFKFLNILKICESLQRKEN